MSKAKKTPSVPQGSSSVQGELKPGNLLRRLVSGIVLICVTLGAIAFSPWALAFIVALIAAAASYEWARMVLSENRGHIFILTAIASFAFVLLMSYLREPIYLALFSVGFALVLRMHGQFRGIKLGLDRLMVGFCYINLGLVCPALFAMHTGKLMPGPLGDLVFIPFDPMALKILMVGVFLTVWASDTMAYVFGKTIGGKKLAPKISPKKTWAGLLGSMVGASVIVTSFVVWVSGMVAVDIPPLWIVVAFGAFLGIAGQVGDLTISKFKREYSVKDTGTIIPGHGGVLDRFDALILMGPFMLIAFKAVF